ncbi:MULTISPECIES: hypothetical protein [Streptomyces]|uniref:Uncharacterized protein n=1 Tax=Streptomyces katrae TaxID=68223 RepID=A0ABT7GX66_9ACTN|nr:MULTISPECIES: hypothetical protein [Streptomyces]MDK9497998.1 hypothetical protein [Streptomyces katrae]
MRTKPTMYKRMLRSALAVVFSAVAVFGAVVAVDGDTGSAQAAAGPSAGTAVESDFGWNSTPAKASS